jgi:hypothetical protein
MGIAALWIARQTAAMGLGDDSAADATARPAANDLRRRVREWETRTVSKLHITVPHSLPPEQAMRKLLAWLQSQDGKTPHVKSLSTVVDNVAKTITLRLDVYGYLVTATISVSASQVEVKTNEATNLVESAAMWIEGLQLKRQLAEVLGP